MDSAIAASAQLNENVEEITQLSVTKDSLPSGVEVHDFTTTNNR